MTVKQLRSIYQIKITLNGIRPAIWRRLLMPSTMTLGELHDVLQIAMGWTDSHLHQFVVGNERYGVLDPEFMDEINDENQFRIRQLLKREKDHLTYEYDFGDGWEHNVVLEKILPFDKQTDLPKCTKGERECPPEDCGGVWGYQEFLQAIQNPSHPEHEEMLEWVDDEFDPEYFDLKETNEVLLEYCGEANRV